MLSKDSMELIAGKKRAWNLVEKLGEGDAGEVFVVESLLERERAILKRPHRSAFTSDIIRQASQIAREGEILRSLGALTEGRDLIRFPRLIDQAKPENEHSERFFIIMSQAQGITLNSLARIIRFNDQSAQQSFNAQPALLGFLNEISRLENIPSLILLQALNDIIAFFEKIHFLEGRNATSDYYGIIWNDVKIDHMFWHPVEKYLTIIDWGNAQYLNVDGTTEDQQHSRLDDYTQLLYEFGNFLPHYAPNLFKRLDWPIDYQIEDVYTTSIPPLKNKIASLLAEEKLAIQILRTSEDNLFQTALPGIEHFRDLGRLISSIVAAGESLDYNEIELFLQRVAKSLVKTEAFDDFIEVCRWGEMKLPGTGSKWRLLREVSIKAPSSVLLANILEAGLDNDYSEMLWSLKESTLQEDGQSWWDQFYAEIRQLHIGSDPIPPYIAMNRLIHTLDALERDERQSTAGLANGRREAHLQGKNLLKRWVQFEPDPPDSDLSYSEIEPFIRYVESILPEGAQSLESTLAQPLAQLQITLDAWSDKNFDLARKGLRNLLVWDPHRQRVLLADQAIQSAPGWLDELGQGPVEETNTEFITRLALRGQELRNQVGPTGWLDELLGAIKLLRNGIEPTDVLLQFPNTRNNLGWLLEIEPDRPLISSTGKALKLDRKTVPLRSLNIPGRRESKLGQQDFQLSEPLDIWAPEARGSSARVFLGRLEDDQNSPFRAAIKIMRPGREDYALELFEAEVKILQRLQDVAGVGHMLECGFIHLDDDQRLPPEGNNGSASHLSGRVQRFNPESIRLFTVELNDRVARGWLPYIAVEKQDFEDNLLLSCDSSYTHGRILPLLDGLVMALQICDILEIAHSRGIVYRDHKILHYYWHSKNNAIEIIDWNIAKLHEEGLSTDNVVFDLVQFGARTLHHILTGRPAPGALPLGPNRPEEVEAASNSYAVQWTYDDQRLPKSLKNILEKLLVGEYQTAKHLRADLHEIYLKISALVEE